MNISISFSWPAGAWINTAWIFLWECLSEKWYYILADKEYDSIIKWWNNVFTLYISDTRNFISKKIDYFFAYDDLAVERNNKVYDLKNIIKIEKTECKYQNVYSVGSAFKILWLDLELGKEKLAKVFSWEVLENNLNDFENWYNKIEKKSELISLDLNQNIWNPRKFMFGNEVIVEWAVVSWLEFYSAYPMTPASSLIDAVTKHKNVIFFQWEDEIAVSMSMLGAHFAWKRAMCGTSWGGFALMVESLAFAAEAEIWWVYIFSQRAGPSTGTPTFTEQADLSFALNSSFWDTMPIVLIPSDYENWYFLIWKALNFADIYQQPVIVMLDKQFSESYISLNMETLKEGKMERWKLIQNSIAEDTFKRYLLEKDGISARSVPWIENWEFIWTSYEHDEYWATSEEPEVKKIMTEKRHQKLKTFVEKEFDSDFYWYEIINPEAKKFFITFGFNKYALENYIADKHELWLIVITVVQPIDIRLKKFFEDNFDSIEELIFVEMNYSWQMETYLRNQFGMITERWNKKIKNIRKYTLYPFFEEDFDATN